MSTVIVLLGSRRAIIKTTPSKSLSEIRTDACNVFSLSPPSSYILKRGSTRLDLSLPFRLSNLSPGAKIDLVRASPASSSQPVSITLRTVDPVDELSTMLPASTTVWGALRAIETDARANGRKGVNITERGVPSKGRGQGRLLYQMPAVRLGTRELTGFEELDKTLEELGCKGRELMVLRFLETEEPLEVALEKIEGLLKTGGEPESSATGDALTPEDRGAALELVPGVEAEQSDKGAPQVRSQTQAEVLEPESKTVGGEPGSRHKDVEMQDAPPPVSDEAQAENGSKIAVFRPPNSAIPAAAGLEVPEDQYEVGIDDLRRIKENYHKEAQPKRLLSDKEMEEQAAVVREQMEKVNTLKITVRYPDGYMSQQELGGKSTAQDLYDVVKTTLRHPAEPFILMIPPRDTINPSAKRLTVDLRLRSGATLHLKWAPEASAKARRDPVLRDELMKVSKQLPKSVEPSAATGKPGSGAASQGPQSEKKKEGGLTKESMEKKLRGFLKLGKK